MTANAPLAVSYYMNGINFQSSAEILSKDMELDEKGIPKKLTAIPFYFLTAHAAELYLKAALLKRGFEEASLKKYDYRHSLNSLLNELQKKGVSVTTTTISVINGLHEQHQSHALRYTVLFGSSNVNYWPPVHLVIAALNELLLLTRLSTQGV